MSIGSFAVTVAAERVRIGIVGLGYWGPNLARNFGALPDAEVAWLCDGRERTLARHVATYPGARTTTDIEEMLADQALDAVVVAVNVPGHAPVGLKVLAAGKHCFIEKPLGDTLAAAQELVAAAGKADRVLMVGHLLEYHPGIQRLKQLVDDGELGKLLYVYSNRQNLGQLRSDENALWSLGPHDVSIALALIGEEPSEASAHGESYMRPGVEDVVFGYMRFPSGVAAHMHLSWLDPHKERRVTVVGSERMATFDDMKIEGKLTVYDKGFDQDFKSYGEYIARAGDIWQPRVSNEEPLRIECRHFVDCVKSGEQPRTDGNSGLRVVRALEALQNSLSAAGSHDPKAEPGDPNPLNAIHV